MKASRVRYAGDVAVSDQALIRIYGIAALHHVHRHALNPIVKNRSPLAASPYFMFVGAVAMEKVRQLLPIPLNDFVNPYRLRAAALHDRRVDLAHFIENLN